MTKRKIHTESSGEDFMYYVLTDAGAICVDIKKIHEFPERRYPQYRVDFQGHTLASKLTLSEARKKATLALKNYR